MSDRRDAPGLHDLLERATDRIAAPDLAERALVTAQRRIKLRRGAAIGGVAAATVAVLVGAMIGMQREVGSSGPATAPTGTESPPPSNETPALDPALIQERWDPRGVDELPTAELGLDLPAEIAPPQSAPLLSDEPIGFAVAAVQRQTVVKVLSADGTWRSVPLGNDRPASAQLSPGGQQLAIGYDGRVDVWAMATGEMRTIGEPAGFQGWDFATFAWVDEATLLLDDATGGWLVDASSGRATQVPYPRGNDYWWSADPAGQVVESRDFPVEPGFVDWAGGQPRAVATAAVGHLARLEASRYLVAATAYDGAALDGFAAFVLDRASGEPTAVLPLGDFDDNYSNWGLSVEALRSDGTVLMRVATIDDKVGTVDWRLVAWDPETGSLAQVSRFVIRDTDQITFSRDVLG